MIHFGEKVISLWNLISYFGYFYSCFLFLSWTSTNSSLLLDRWVHLFPFLLDRFLNLLFDDLCSRSIVVNHRLLDRWVYDLLSSRFNFFGLLLELLHLGFRSVRGLLLLLQGSWLQLMEDYVAAFAVLFVHAAAFFGRSLHRKVPHFLILICESCSLRAALCAVLLLDRTWWLKLWLLTGNLRIDSSNLHHFLLCI